MYCINGLYQKADPLGSPRTGILSMIFAICMLLCCATAATPEEVFSNPPPKAHAGVWWHWMGGQVTKEGIVKDLDWFKRIGISSATVFGMADSTTPWARRIGDIPTHGMHPFDERWWRLFAFACREGKKRGIDIGIHNCPGYTSTGGPWIPSRLAMRELVFNITNAVEQISTKPNALYPVFNEDSGRYELPPCPARQTDVVEIGVGRGGIRVAHIPMGSFVQPADWGSFGLECDKMSEEAVDFHLDHVFGELKRHLGGDLPAAGLRHVLLDSYEAGTPSWTPRMREEFTSRRGYDPLEFLPILGGYVDLYSDDEVAKFKTDFSRTVEELYRDVLFKRMAERIHAEGLEFSCEPYVGPFVAREVAPFIDRIMTEFWYSTSGSDIGAHRRFNSFPAPDGRRRNIVEAEAFTGLPAKCQWTEMPENLKPGADDAFLSGVNRLILHSCPLQPWGDDVKPGVTMGWWGTHFGRNQTWAECGKAWFDYIARCQALLQWGMPSLDSLTLPVGVRQCARTDGRRTLFFVVAGTNGTARLGLPRGKWFDPVSGKIGGVPLRLAPRQSGFYERDESAPECVDARHGQVVLKGFEPELGDRSLSSNAVERYFSGTLVYRTRFDMPRDAKRLKISVKAYEQVVVVRLNGKEVGTIWCSPWEVELPEDVLIRSGNSLEIEVTNSWRNRLIGDEQEPQDCEFEASPKQCGEFLSRYPAWFTDGMSARTARGRKCFTTWNYFTSGSQLTPSGLVEPPIIFW